MRDATARQAPTDEISRIAQTLFGNATPMQTEDTPAVQHWERRVRFAAWELICEWGIPLGEYADEDRVCRLVRLHALVGEIQKGERLNRRPKESRATNQKLKQQFKRVFDKLDGLLEEHRGLPLADRFITLLGPSAEDEISRYTQETRAGVLTAISTHDAATGRTSSQLRALIRELKGTSAEAWLPQRLTPTRLIRELDGLYCAAGSKSGDARFISGLKQMHAVLGEYLGDDAVRKRVRRALPQGSGGGQNSGAGPRSAR